MDKESLKKSVLSRLDEEGGIIQENSGTPTPTAEESHKLMREKLDKILEEISGNNNGKKKVISSEIIMSSIFGFAVGDALGVPIEFLSREHLKKNPCNNMIGYGSHSVPAGTWSDDTSMTIATMDSIIENKEINYDDIMNKFCEWYANSKYTATGKFFDIGNTTSMALNKYIRGTNPINCGGTNENNNGNGSLMRILPIVFYSYKNNLSDFEDVELINNISSLTHGHEISKLGCKIYSDYIKEILDGKNKYEAMDIIKQKDYTLHYSKNSIDKYKRILSDDIEKLPENNISSSGYIVSTLEAVLWCILNTNNYKEAVLKAINLGMDTDTVGAITGSIGGILYGFEDIPKEWLIGLKNSEYLSNICSEFFASLSYEKTI